MIIQNNRETVEQITTKMTNAADLIESAIQRPVTKADQTTLAVSVKALEAHEEMERLVQMFHTAFVETIEHIQLAATEFERTDRELHDSLQNMFTKDSDRDI